MYGVRNETSVLNPATFNNPPCPVRVTVTKAVTMARAAWANERAGQTDQALDLYERAMEMLQPTMPPSHWEVAVPVLNNWASLLRSDGKYAEAEARFLEALELLRTESNPKLASVTACIMRNLADMYHGLGHKTEAQELIQQASSLKPPATPPGRQQAAA